MKADNVDVNDANASMQIILDPASTEQQTKEQFMY